MTAADVRKHVMTGSLMMLHPGSLDMTFQDGSATQTLNLIDVVDPVDVEEALAQRRTSALYDISSTTTSPRKPYRLRLKSCFCPSRVSEFPADDVEVRIVPREWTTIDSPIPTETKEPKMYWLLVLSLKIEPHVRDIISSFTDQFSLIQKRYQQYGSADAYVRMVTERPIIVRSTSRQIFEADAGHADRIARSVSVVGDQLHRIRFLKGSRVRPRHPPALWVQQKENRVNHVFIRASQIQQFLVFITVCDSAGEFLPPRSVERCTATVWTPHESHQSSSSSTRFK
uniref:DUF3398 domain-containing protein n=1 Tax=Angiostrongylus cantonensis TaxID=6313 RepID=A0A0K0CXL0_ANGCA